MNNKNMKSVDNHEFCSFCGYKNWHVAIQWSPLEAWSLYRCASCGQEMTVISQLNSEDYQIEITRYGEKLSDF